MKRDGATSDIKKSWLNPIRAAQAACSGNKGLAILTLTILVDHNNPVRWMEPRLEKVHPIKKTEDNCNDDVLGALLSSAQVDNT